MPIPKNASKDEVAHDFKHGKTYARTRGKYGKRRANKQLVAVMLRHQREKKGRRRVRRRE